MKTRPPFPVALLATLAAACSAATAPEEPSWQNDVFPILQGSCNHCHGATVGQVPKRDGSGNMAQPLTRLDFCKAPSDSGADADIQSLMRNGAISMATFIRSKEPIMGSIRVNRGRASMPPPPALELTDYEVDVLLNWADAYDDDKNEACQKRRNRAPTAKVLDRRQDGDVLVVTIDVSDTDGDQVVGKLRAGTNQGDILRSGRQEVRIPGSREGDSLSVRLHDGYDKAELNL